MPRTKLGKWSLSLIGAFFVSVLVFLIFIADGQRGGQGFFDNLYLAITGLLAGACGIASFVVGLIAIIRRHERSAFVFIAVFIGALITLWIGMEVLFTH